MQSASHGTRLLQKVEIEARAIIDALARVARLDRLKGPIARNQLLRHGHTLPKVQELLPARTRILEFLQKFLH